jgi:APA family basic amino acid/polyamine antiporter
MLGCAVLFAFLPTDAKLVFPLWGTIGLVFYYLYGYRKSHLALGIPTVSGGEDLLTEVRPLAEWVEDGEEDGEKP